MEKTYEFKASGLITRKDAPNTRQPYEHQKDAQKNLDIVNKSNNFATLVVLPTGGGKTYTATVWLLRNAIDKNHKVLWLAHRQMLLEQAAETFQYQADLSSLTNKTSFRYRIISGASSHDRISNISPSDDLLVISKDTLGRGQNLSQLDKWLDNSDSLYLVIDEAHHAVAKSYRKVIDHIKEKVINLKIIGLTATPFRTFENEKGLLEKIFTDGINSEGQFVKNASGRAYQIGLKDLINRQILSKPIFERYETNEDYTQGLGMEALEKLNNFDQLPIDIQEKIAKNAARNQLIVNKYIENKNRYKQTIVFVINVTHAIALNKIFLEHGIKSAYVVSTIKDERGVTISTKDNEANIEKFKKGEINVLINVNILTEGVDIPQTQTVFLARPTVSIALMTQMVGRALRGQKAGGTPDAYIVSFIDNWDENQISWASPEAVFDGVNSFEDMDTSYRNQNIRYIQISKIEEFAKILDDNIDTSDLEALPFEQRIPVGMYSFRFVENNDGEYEGAEKFCQVMVYDLSRTNYEEMLKDLPSIFYNFKVDDMDDLTSEKLSEMEEYIALNYFSTYMIPPYDAKDVKNLIKYYAYSGEVPTFYTIDDQIRKQLDVSSIAQEIYDKDMGGRAQNDFLNSIWDNSDHNIIKLFFPREINFRNAVRTEFEKISRPDLYATKQNVQFDMRSIEDFTLYEIMQREPKMYNKLHDEVFKKAKTEDGKYQCAICGRKFDTKFYLQIDHITPMNKGGKTVLENLQCLCRSCNSRKSDN